MKVTSSLAPHLRWFQEGHHIDVCVDICNQFGRLFPSHPYGVMIKQGNLRELRAKGYITKKTIYISELQYTRFYISEFGKENFEEYKNDCSR